MPRGLCFTPATELARLSRSHEVSPLEVMRAVPERLDRVNPLRGASSWSPVTPTSPIGELLRTQLWHRVHAFFESHDLWLTPTAAVPPFPIELPHAMEIGGRPAGKTLQRSYLTYAFSVLGLPAISIPCGFTRDGLPIGLQIVGRPRQEATVLRAAAAFEAAPPWAHRIPPVVTQAA